MKRSLSFATMLLIAVISLAVFVNQSVAQDLVLDTTIKSTAVRVDKNGNDYVRFIIVEQKELNGIQYNADTVVMCFGSVVEAAKGYSDGDPLKAIAATNEYKGRTNYNILAFIE